MNSDKVNWKQARVDAAISAMNGILSRRNNLPFNTLEKEISEELAQLSVVLADALIAELKKPNETK
jgi:lambda repressor-like predicted transcriptional regulator